MMLTAGVGSMFASHQTVNLGIGKYASGSEALKGRGACAASIGFIP
jgi:hypothetical protein